MGETNRDALDRSEPSLTNDFQPEKHRQLPVKREIDDLSDKDIKVDEPLHPVADCEGWVPWIEDDCKE